ncbi:YiaA/YiaB family inner membrane protein [Frankia sp. AgKG'84/4]|uniref:YiaA/YiaB family inner membrane protein n=1 Tax=Frankia sp. AgKG'84/4 TaxID=573490 RepID=UPI002010B897|nr:YiaA/YiaB family inner membrane protein [Frankia sp. AgKG'84/4]MCL9792732.1 hypothetical protein [Frankia sp. AgKG'84/4]
MVQAALSFGVSVIAVTYAITHLPGDAWIRGFLLLGLLYVVTSTDARRVRPVQTAARALTPSGPLT